MDKRRSFGGNTRTSDRLLIRVIEKAKQYANDPVLEQIREEIKNTDINSLSPIDALLKLNKIKKHIEG